MNFIDDSKIKLTLEQARNININEINEILDKAENFKGLSTEEVAALIQNEDTAVLYRIFKIAGKIKEHIYGDRIVMFAPVYVSDYCVNECDYCGYKCSSNFKRTKLTMEQLRSEIKELEKMGHKRLALEAGEDPVNVPIEYVLECLKTIYETKLDNGEIRRVNINIASTNVENYKKLVEVGIGTYILFQETYDKKRYEEVHAKGPKHNYEYHLTAFDRAMEAGIDDVGAGVLFGLSNWKYEVIGLMMHNQHLEDKFGVGFHTISVPRLCPADGLDMSMYPEIVDDETFLKLVAIIRIAVPFTGMIISTRETPDMRQKLIKIGISQTSGGSNVNVGGYTEDANLNETKSTQFEVSDTRKNMDIVRWLMDEKLVPSFCTACYRSGRTGDRFMSLAKSGNIKNVCLPNALMTLQEYACDYGDDNIKEKANAIIEKQIPNIENEKIKTLTILNIDKIKNGARDLYL